MNYKNFLEKRANVTSQYGEDGIIGFLIDLLGDDLKKVCLEVGAGDGETFSNTFKLWRNGGWKALLIEASSDRFGLLETKTRNMKNVKILNSKISYEGVNSIASIAKSANFSLDGGLVVIDIDSYDSYIFENLPPVTPSIVVVEYNNSIPPFINYRDVPDQIFLRCSIKALEEIGKKNGYSLICSTITNAFFIKEDLAKKHCIDAASAEDCYLYEEQHKNGSLHTMIVFSQLVTSYPVFIYKPHIFDRIFYNFRALIKTLIGREPYKIPSASTQLAIRKSGLWC